VLELKFGAVLLAAVTGISIMTSLGPKDLAPGFARAATAAAQEASPGAKDKQPAAANVCIGCHSPVDGPPLSGKLMGRWLAPNITPDRLSGIGAWPRESLFRYLRYGSASGRGQAGGPMAAVVESLQGRSDADIDALVDWLMRQPAQRDPADKASASERGEKFTVDPALLRPAPSGTTRSLLTGAALYNTACASCHGADGTGSADGHFPSMFHNSAVGRRTPYNLVAALLSGVERHVGTDAVLMQSFDGRQGISGGLTDDELATLSNFILKQFGDPASATLTKDDIDRSRAGWWKAGQPNAQRGQVIVVGGGPGGAGAACFNCHGLQGQGDASAGFPRLTGLDVEYFAKQMRDYTAGTRTNEAMRSIARDLDPADHQSLALYYAGLPAQKRLARRDATADPGLVQRGAALYAIGATERGIQACADCHGPLGQGFNPVYPSLTQPPAYIEGQLRLWRNRARRNDPHDLMGSISRRLSDDDIQALTAFLGVLVP
jgi:cytochrome c553